MKERSAINQRTLFFERTGFFSVVAQRTGPGSIGLNRATANHATFYPLQVLRNRDELALDSGPSGEERDLCWPAVHAGADEVFQSWVESQS